MVEELLALQQLSVVWCGFWIGGLISPYFYENVGLQRIDALPNNTMDSILLFYLCGCAIAKDAAVGDNKSALSSVIDKKSMKSVEELKTKTDKRDSSDQTFVLRLNTGEESFRPILGANYDQYQVASSAQAVYDKGPTPGGSGGVGVGGIHYASGAVISQQNIVYAVPHNTPQNRERNPHIQSALQQQQEQQAHSLQPQPVQHVVRAALPQPQKIQYVIAIPMSYLRQLQQQLVQQQQQQLHPQPQHVNQAPTQQALVASPSITTVGGLRFAHRFNPSSGSDITPVAGLTKVPSLPGYTTQLVQIPTSVLVAAAQAAAAYQRPNHQPVYQQHSQPIQPQATQQHYVYQQHAQPPKHPQSPGQIIQQGPLYAIHIPQQQQPLVPASLAPYQIIHSQPSSARQQQPALVRIGSLSPPGNQLATQQVAGTQHVPVQQQQQHQQPPQSVSEYNIKQQQQQPQPPPVVAPAYQPAITYNPQFIIQRIPLQHQQHFVQQPPAGVEENLNYAPYTQGIPGNPAPLPFIRIATPHPTHYYPFLPSPEVQQPIYVSNLPTSVNKVAPYANVALPPTYANQDIGVGPDTGVPGPAVRYFNHHGGVHYGNQIFHTVSAPTASSKLADSTATSNIQPKQLHNYLSIPGTATPALPAAPKRTGGPTAAADSQTVCQQVRLASSQGEDYFIISTSNESKDLKMDIFNGEIKQHNNSVRRVLWIAPEVTRD
ncbi:putative uncharacterized protein DDB_G0291608 [Glossina fuscipes]|uniref:Uncharacterized protein n=1 Tax=Glossina fuscipes TaxID=7396 RepID=A0A8U0WGJ5_9MUSC|nr:putative uncharacterized protein DDB_G0291608 [Glossina fuscipes]